MIKKNKIYIIALLLVYGNFIFSADQGQGQLTSYLYKLEKGLSYDYEKLPDLYKLLKKVYKEDFFGNTAKIQTNLIGEVGSFLDKAPLHNQQKQIALKELLDKEVKKANSSNDTNIKKMFNSIRMVSCERSIKIIRKSNALRVPVYYGRIEEGLFDNEAYKDLRKELNPNFQYEKSGEINIFKETSVNFPAMISPCWKWVEGKLIENGEVGVVFSHGVNFESEGTPDYKEFHGKGKKEKLKEQIDKIGECIVRGAYEMTVGADKKVCELRVPPIGLGQFCQAYKGDKSELANMYVKAIYKALQKYYNIQWHFNVYNFRGGQQEFKVAFEAIEKDNKNQRIIFNYSEDSIFNNPAIEVTKRLTVFAHASDPHAFLGNGGYKDVSLERCLAGYGNDNFLTLFFISNLYLSHLLNNAEVLPVKINIYKQEKFKISKEKLEERLTVFCEIYNNNFWGEDAGRDKKQKALFRCIQGIVENADNEESEIKKMIALAFIASPDDEDTVKKSIFWRVPIYYGKIMFALFYTEAFKKLTKMQYGDKSASEEVKIFEKLNIVFPAVVSPYYQWNSEKENLEEKGRIGIVFSHGVNFESNNTPDYKKFIDEKGNVKKEKLKEYIVDIARCLVKAAVKLTHDKGFAICNLKIPAFGLTYFASCYPGDKEELAEMYIEEIYNALSEESSEKMTFYADFFDYKPKPISGYKDAFDKIDKDNKDNKNKFLYLKYYNYESSGRGSTYHPVYDPLNSQEIENKHLIVFAHSGDPHSFLGNGGFTDNSLEQNLIGVMNNYFLNPALLLNLFLYEMAFGDSQVFVDQLEVPESPAVKSSKPLSHIRSFSGWLKENKKLILLGGGFLFFGVVYYLCKEKINKNACTVLAQLECVLSKLKEIIISEKYNK